MENSSNNKVIGIEIAKYAKICYILILIAAGYGLLTNIAGLAAVYLPGGFMTGLLGITGVVLALLGLFVFKDSFGSVDLSHFRFIGVMFVAFFLIYAVVVNALAKFGFIGLLIIILISVTQVALFYAGFKTHGAGQEASRASIEGTLRSLIKR
ncbi:MAG: hypothetical protein R3D88_00675 [Alphaproteobacteria bacterium]|nr:hypothetical protein [Alphaproteobacteria bacterium]